jgi:hypothetical protein
LPKLGPDFRKEELEVREAAVVGSDHEGWLLNWWIFVTDDN